MVELTVNKIEQRVDCVETTKYYLRNYHKKFEIYKPGK